MEPLQRSDPPQIGRFRVVGRLGAGGMGRVYLGETPEGARAAVKVIRDDLAGDPDFKARFRREVGAAVSVAGMFTARVLDADPDGDPPWLATQFVEGPSLRDAVRHGGPMPAEAVLNLAQGLAEALGAIHAAGLTHRDLKPANVLLSPTGPRVIDFGIARAPSSTQLTGTGEIIGTPDFMAPEQISGGTVGAPADVFALGSTLVFAAVGHGPFAADHTAATLFRIVSVDPDLTDLAEDLHPVVTACLAKDPAKRPTAQELAVGLRAGSWAAGASTPSAGPHPGGALPLVGQETVVPGEAAGPTVEVHTPRRRRIRRIGVIALVALVALTGVSAAVIYAGTTSTADPSDPRVRYLDRLCRSGALLSTISDALITSPSTDDRAQLKQDFLSTTERVGGVVAVALADLVPLRDEAPNQSARVGFTLMVDSFTKAQKSFADAHDELVASEPMTDAAFDDATEKLTDGASRLALAARVIDGITLPDDYTAVRRSVPSCNT